MLSLQKILPLSLVAFTIGCMSSRHQDQTLQQAQYKDKQTGEMLGAGIGAGFGIFAGKQLGDKLGWKEGKGQVLGALVFGITGASVGRKVGETVAERRAQYAEEKKQLDAQIAMLDQRLSELSATLKHLKQQVEGYESVRVHAQRQERTERGRSQQTSSDLASINAMLDSLRRQKQALELDIKRLREEVAHAEEILKNYPDRKSVQEYHRKLVVRRDQFLAHLESVTTLEGRLHERRRSLLPSS